MSERTVEQELKAKLDQVEGQRKEAKDQLDRERLIRVTGDVIKTITDQGFVEKMRLAREGADKGEGLDAAAKLLSLEGLREAGVDIPEDFRLTSRVFEDRLSGFRLDIDPVKIDPLAPIAWGACAGGGGLTFCGCGGFST